MSDGNRRDAREAVRSSPIVIMDAPILRNLGPTDLAEAADANFVTHAAWLPRRLPGMTVVDRPDLLLVDSGLPCDTYNVSCRARLESRDAQERASAAVAYFRHAQRPFSWWVGPADRPPDLGDVLLAAGLSRAETELAMSAALSELPPVQGSLPLRVARVVSEEELRAFATLSAANWQPPDPQVIRFYDLASGAPLAGDCPQWLYVGLLGDTPVATTELTVAGGVVGLYGISTLAAHRGLGFGTALTLRPLLDARERGHETAVLQAAAAGVGIYERLGFRTFGQITEYKPTDPQGLGLSSTCSVGAAGGRS